MEKVTRVKVRHVNTVFQIEATECGAACFAMILGYYGRYISLDEARTATGVSRDGVKAGNILRTAPSYGMEAHGFRKETDALLKLTPPCIIHWNFNHFVVYEGYDGKYVYLNDPAAGKRKLTLDEFNGCFTGIVITLVPTTDFEKKKRTDSIVKFAIDRNRVIWKDIAVLIFTGLFLAFFGIILAFSSQIFIDYVLSDEVHNLAAGLLTVIAWTIVLQIIFSYMREKQLLRIQNKQGLLTARSFFYHMLRLPAQFFDQRYAGDLSSRVSSNEDVNQFLTGDFSEFVIGIIESVIFLIIMIAYSPLLTLSVIIGLTIEILCVAKASSYMKEGSMKISMDAGKLAGALYAGIGIIDSLKASGAESFFMGRLLGRYAKVSDMEQKLGRTQQVINVIPQALLTILNVIILMQGSILVIHDKMTVGMLLSFTTIFSMFLAPVNQFSGFAMQLQMIKSSVGRVKDIMQYPEEAKYEVKENDGIKLDGKLKLTDVSFGYSRLDKPLIEDFSLELEKGKSVAIVGASGSGKSTVAKLVCGLYEPWSGNIELDDIPISKISNTTLSQSVSNVSQSISIFHGTIRDNITLWNDRIPKEDILKAAKDACIHDVITAKEGAYDHILAQGGMDMSGGQRQRLEIARALVKNPSLIVLDEATSALDPITEKQVLDNIKNRGISVLTIAHRLSAVRDCDEIIVMHKGHIAERGSHDYLMENGTIYPQLIRLN